MKYSKEFYKDIEQLSYYVYKENKFDKPKGWKSIKIYENKRNGFYAETFENNLGQKILIYRGTDTSKGFDEERKDISADIKLGITKIPQQAYDAYLAYEDANNRYDESVTVAGYSLGGSLAQIVCNETGADGITFAAYGVGNIIKAKNTENIINLGNENDPIFNFRFSKHLGDVYVMPDERSLMYKGSSLEKHMPNKLGDISKAVPYMHQPVFKLHASYDKYDDKLLTPYNRVFYENEMKIADMDEDTLKQFVNQYYDDNYKFPQKEELERRVRFGELIYVTDYVRQDGTKVNGYYRRCPQK